MSEFNFASLLMFSFFRAIKLTQLSLNVVFLRLAYAQSESIYY